MINIKTPLNISDPILPSIGIGGIKIDQNIADLKDWIQFNMFLNNNEDQIYCEVLNGLFINYSCLDDALSFTVDIITGKVKFINANYGYKGELFNGIKPGITYFELKDIHEDLIFRDGFLFLEGVEGIRIEVPDEYEIYDDLESFPDFIIETMTVYKD